MMHIMGGSRERVRLHVKAVNSVSYVGREGEVVGEGSDKC